MRLAIWQACADLVDPNTVLDRIAIQLDAAARAGARLMVAPELLFPGYNRADLHATLSQPMDGQLIADVAQMTRRLGCGLAFGWAERDGERVYNAASAIDADGRLLAHYRKRALYGEMEAASFVPGDRTPETFMLESYRAALLVCYDVEFPRQPEDLADRGVDLILVPTANPAGFEHVQSLLVPTRAYDNRQIIAYANYCGADHGLAFGGRSVIAGPDGQAIVSAGGSEALIVTDLPQIGDYPDDLLSQTRSS